MQNSLQIGDIIAKKYQVLSQLGQGKFGTVFQVRNTETDEIRALKTESRRAPVRLLKNETAVLKYLYEQGCRCCPIIYWYGIIPDTSCLIFSYYTITLYDYLHIRPLSLEKKNELMARMIDMLESVHRHFVLHRDIKPENFMIHNGELFLIDFGFATFYVGEDGDHLPNMPTENLVGTPKYLSYHIHSGNSASRRDDMISLGYIYLWMTTGELPWTCDNYELDAPNIDKTSIHYPANVYRKEKKSWANMENLALDTPILRYLEHLYRMNYEGSPLYGQLQKLFYPQNTILK
jgi:casein kinase 1